MRNEFKHFLFTENHIKQRKGIACNGCRVAFRIGDSIHKKRGKGQPYYCEDCYRKFFV